MKRIWIWVKEDKNASIRIFHKQLSNLNCIYFVKNAAIGKFKFIIIWKESKNTNKYKCTTFAIIFILKENAFYIISSSIVNITATITGLNYDKFINYK